MKKKGDNQEIPNQLQVVIIKKNNGVYSQEIKMNIPSSSTFGDIVSFMNQNGLLESKNTIIRPAHNQNHIIGHNRKLSQCYNVIKLRFIFEDNNNKKNNANGKIQALRDQNSYEADRIQKKNICGKQQCVIM